MIKLFPPAGDAPFKRFTLHSGTTYFPDFSNGGCVKVQTEDDAVDLESEGWTRDAASRKAANQDAVLRKAAGENMLRRHFGSAAPLAKGHSAPSDSELLTRGLAAQLNRIPGGTGSALIKSRIRINGVAIGNGVLARVEYDIKDGGMVIAGTAIDIAEVDADQRARFVDAAQAIDSALSEAVVASARATIESVVRSVLRTKPAFGAAVRGRARATA
jgi:hypothetical protein